MASKNAWKTTLLSNTTTAIETLGALREEEDSEGTKAYRYVKANEAVAAGDVCTAITPAWNVNTTTLPAITARVCVGIGIGTITAGSYGWIQVRGLCSNITMSTSASLVAGNPLCVSGTAKKALQYTAAGTYAQGEAQNAGLIFGFAATDTSSTTVGNAILRCC